MSKARVTSRAEFLQRTEVDIQVQGHPRKKLQELGHTYLTSRREKATASQIHNCHEWGITQQRWAKGILCLESSDKQYGWWPLDMTATQDG